MNPLRALFLAISRTPPAVMLAAIIGLAVVATFAVTSEVNSRKQHFDDLEKQMADKAHAKSTIVYAIKDVPEGSPIPSEALEEKQVEASKVPADAISSASLASGRVSKFGLMANQIVSQHDLAPNGVSQGFDSLLKEGFRAVTFAVDANSGVAGFVAPQSHVDVIGMVGSGSETKANAILSDVEVIAVGQQYQKAPGAATAVPASSITVAVPSGDAQKLIKAILASKLYLALRNDKDHTPVATVDVTSMFAKPLAQQNSMALLPSPSPLPNPPIIQGGGIEVVPAQRLSPPDCGIMLHEIEAWSGAKKDVLSVPKE